VHEFALVVPVKPPTVGKSRLRGIDDEHRRALAQAFALDTIAVCLEVGAVGVLVSTDDAAFAVHCSALGCATMPDGDSNDLNSALGQAAAEARRRWPDAAPVALCADLPALTAGDLRSALRNITAGTPAFVADAAGTGTTLYTASYATFDPRFGTGSRRAHLESGAAEIGGALPTLRLDVDDLDDLRAAIDLGVGPQTRRLAHLFAAAG
jgi:2-phospho-L-lactate/phosphoenolpyruvate guanylyltransferase